MGSTFKRENNAFAILFMTQKFCCFITHTVLYNRYSNAKLRICYVICICYVYVYFFEHVNKLNFNVVDTTKRNYYAWHSTIPKLWHCTIWFDVYWILKKWIKKITNIKRKNANFFKKIKSHAVKNIVMRHCPVPSSTCYCIHMYCWVGFIL